MEHSHQILKSKEFLNEENIGKMSELLKLASDPTRLKILFCLIEGEKAVCCIQEDTNKSQSLISHQLKKLKDANLVKSRNEGNNVYYSLNDYHVHTLLGVAFDHVMEETNNGK